MKILAVNMSLDPVTGGGTAERTLQLCKQWANIGENCEILTLDIGINNELYEHLQQNNIGITVLPNINRRFYVPVPFIRTIKNIVLGSEVILLMGHWTIINAVVYHYAKKYKRKYAVCPAGALQIFGRSKIIKNIFNIIIGKKLIQNANYFIAVAENELAQYANYGVQKEKIVIIPNGVNYTDYQIDGARDFDKIMKLENVPYILFLGRLNLIKGADILLNAFIRVSSLFPDYNLIFAGPDEGLLTILKNNAKKYSLENKVHFVGHLGGKIKTSALKSATLLVVPSRQEAMSIVALEAGICGVPVLLTDQCGFNNIKEIGGGGVVSANETDLAQGLITLLGNREKLQKMGAAFQEHILNHYTWDVAAKSHLSLFKKG